MTVLTAQDKKWRAESDAYNLIEAETIISDKTRHSAALREVKTIVKKKKAEAVAAERVVKKKVVKKKVVKKKPVKKPKRRVKKR